MKNMIGTNPVPGLSARVAELSPEDLASINVTWCRYALGTDDVDADMLGSTFTHDAVLIGGIAGAQPLVEKTGCDAIVKYVIETRTAHGYVERHLITNIAAERYSETSARVHAYGLVTRLDGSAVINSTTAVYNALMVREDDGVWHFSRIDVVTDAPMQ
jgi:purine nucleoside permease